MLLSVRVLIAKIDTKVLPYYVISFSFPTTKIPPNMPKLTRLYYYGKTEARNADVYKLHQVKTLQNMLGTKKKLACTFWGCFHIASERFMFCNMHEDKNYRKVSVAVWGLCTLHMTYVDVFLLVWWQTAASAQQIAPRREHRALTSLTPPAAYHWASTGCVGTQIQGTRDQRLEHAQKGDIRRCAHVYVCVSISQMLWLIC